MTTFARAVHLHHAVMRAAAADHQGAQALWHAITGLGEVPSGHTFAEAVRDTVPIEHAAMLSYQDVAAAFAFDQMWRADDALAPSATAFERRDLARRAWARFAERAAKTEDFAHGFGWDLSAAWTQVREIELDRRDLSLAERVARLAGRMHIALRGHLARRVARVPEEVYAVELGNDIGRLLPSELVLLNEPVLETVLLERLATRRALQFATRGTAPATRGPLVVVLDESSSMEGRRNIWAKAAVVALARVATADHRRVAVVHFSSSAVVRSYAPNDPASVLAMIEHFLSGGTAIALGLQAGVEQVRDLAAKGHRGADLVLLTDGVDPDHAPQEAALREAFDIGARLWTVAIEVDVAVSAPIRSSAASFVRLADQQMSDADVLAGVPDAAYRAVNDPAA